MARYTRRASPRRSTRSRYATRRVAPRARVATRSRGRSRAAPAMRLVIEHVTNPGPNPALLPIGLKPGPAPKKSKF